MGNPCDEMTFVAVCIYEVHVAVKRQNGKVFSSPPNKARNFKPIYTHHQYLFEFSALPSCLMEALLSIHRQFNGLPFYLLWHEIVEIFLKPLIFYFPVSKCEKSIFYHLKSHLNGPY